MAKYLGISFSAMNQWERGDYISAKVIQDQLFVYCEENSVPLIDFIRDKIKAAVQEIELAEHRILLYHASKRGLEGKIAPISRKHCDFGTGFYMGTQPEQALTFVCDFPKSKFYLVSVKMDGIHTIEIPADLEWALLVAYHRGRSTLSALVNAGS